MMASFSVHCSLVNSRCVQSLALSIRVLLFPLWRAVGFS